MTLNEAYAFLSHGCWLVDCIYAEGCKRSYEMIIPLKDQYPVSIPLSESFFWRLYNRWSFDVSDDKDKSNDRYYTFYYLHKD